MRRLILPFILLVLLSACGRSSTAERVDVFYAVVISDQAQQIPQTVRATRLPLTEEVEPLTFAAERMTQSPDDNALRSAFPEGTEVLGVRVEDSCAIFTLSEQWLTAVGMNKTLAEYCMLKTALQFEDVISARWEAAADDGELLTGPILRAETYIDTPLELVPARYEITLYFADASGSSLAAEKRPVVLRESESAEWYRQVIDGLIAGPLTADLLPVMPVGTRLLPSVTVENRVCYVNFSREFITNAAGDTNTARLTLRSLVQSLTELPGVTSVKIRVEGEELTDYFGLDVSLPLGRDDKALTE